VAWKLIEEKDEETKKKLATKKHLKTRTFARSRRQAA